MYNRYIPQSDGTYRKNSVEDPCRESPASAPQPPPCRSEASACSAGSFLKNLIPPDLDAGDLLVILLLLLMAGDGKQDALLTLALYLYL